MKRTLYSLLLLFLPLLPAAPADGAVLRHLPDADTLVAHADQTAPAVPDTLVGNAAGTAAAGNDTLTITADLTAPAAPDTLVNPATGIPHFNALDYSMQKRHTARRCQFPRATRFAHNMYIAVGTRFQRLCYREYAQMGRNALLQFTAAKEFNAFHGVRLTFYGGRADSKAKPTYYSRIALSADYLFNPTAYIWGYDPYRPFECLVSAGLGAGWSHYRAQNNRYIEANLGLQLKVHLQPQLNLLVEPQLSLYTDGVDVHSYRNAHRYDLGYGLAIGLNYYLYDPMRATTGRYDGRTTAYRRNLFVALSGGPQFQLSHLTRRMGIPQSMREHLQLSVGTWINPWIGVRLSPFYSCSLWNQRQDGPDAPVQSLHSYYYGFRLDALVDVVRLLRPSYADPTRCTLLALAGIENGIIHKQDGPYHVHDFYAGLTTGLQFKVDLVRGYSLYLEPAYSFVPYSYLPVEQDHTYLPRMHFHDHLFRLCLGVQYSF